ncbi:hypothetical protein [Marinicella litoralis]|uniref:Uncharacterized protein n=1 Tax=Marinicella litoralis TaxID=644220 RepID=A0A4R6XGG4_9GAMM|nr:hypothetical protein [Marinicella litoralis]TDR16377.1 hypothetical protein C8D91_2904 [Marinicella litoralis]
MNDLKIYYHSEKDEYFVHHDVSKIHYIELDFRRKEVNWKFYLTLPEGMHWKAGDQMGGLGCDHHVKTQSFEEFIEKPHLELPPEKLSEALKCMGTPEKI